MNTAEEILGQQALATTRVYPFKRLLTSGAECEMILMQAQASELKAQVSKDKKAELSSANL